jgi:hypothetical protein
MFCETNATNPSSDSTGSHRCVPIDLFIIGNGLEPARRNYFLSPPYFFQNPSAVNGLDGW